MDIQGQFQKYLDEYEENMVESIAKTFGAASRSLTLDILSGKHSVEEMEKRNKKYLEALRAIESEAHTKRLSIKL